MSTSPQEWESKRHFLPQQEWASHLLAVCRADWRSDIRILTKYLERIWISGNLQLCHNSVPRSTAVKTAWTGGKKGKRNSKILGSKLSMGSPALETSQAGPFSEHCAIQDSSLCRFAAHLQILLLWKSLTELPPAFRAQLGYQCLWMCWLHRHLNWSPGKIGV